MGNSFDKVGNSKSAEKSDKKYKEYFDLFQEELNKLINEHGLNEGDLKNSNILKEKVCSAHVVFYNRFSNYSDKDLEKVAERIGLIPDEGIYKSGKIPTDSDVCEFIYTYIDARVQLIQFIINIFKADNCIISKGSENSLLNTYDVAVKFRELHDKSLKIEKDNEVNGTSNKPPLNKNDRDRIGGNLGSLYKHKKIMLNLIEESYNSLENKRFSISNTAQGIKAKIFGGEKNDRDYEYVTLKKINELKKKIEDEQKLLIRICDLLYKDSLFMEGTTLNTI